MRIFWSDPYLWIHLAGIAAVPLCLLLCLLGFAAGNPILPAWLELGLVAIIGIAPIAWMQLQKPFYIFSLLAVALRPERLTESQRRIAALFVARRNPLLIGLVALVLFLILKQLYAIAPIASEIVPIKSYGLGLVVAAIGFFASNLFSQVPLSVILVMLAQDSEFLQTAPLSVDQIRRDLLVFGLPVDQIVSTIATLPTPPSPSSTDELPSA